MIERARALGGTLRETLPYLALIALVGPSALGVNLGPEASKFIADHGISTVVLLAGLAIAPRFLRAHQELADSVRDFTNREEMQIREVIINQKVTLEHLRRMEDRIQRLPCTAEGERAERPCA